MRRISAVSLCALLCGLWLTACGASPTEAEPAPGEELLGTRSATQYCRAMTTGGYHSVKLEEDGGPGPPYASSDTRGETPFLEAARPSSPCTRV